MPRRFIGYAHIYTDTPRGPELFAACPMEVSNLGLLLRWLGQNHDSLVPEDSDFNREFQRLCAEVREALEGDSNDAEHDALVSVAELLQIDYQPPEE